MCRENRPREGIQEKIWGCVGGWIFFFRSLFSSLPVKIHSELGVQNHLYSCLEITISIALQLLRSGGHKPQKFYYHSPRFSDRDGMKGTTGIVNRGSRFLNLSTNHITFFSRDISSKVEYFDIWMMMATFYPSKT